MRSLPKTIQSLLLLGAGLIALAWLLFHKSQEARLQAAAYDAEFGLNLRRANGARSKARDHAERANAAKRRWQQHRDALEKAGHPTAAQILQRLNKHARTAA